jgi:hypothetical protein
MSRVNLLNAGQHLASESMPYVSSVAEVPPASRQAAEVFKLRRSGAKAYRFSGTQLCTAMSYTPGYPFWYEISIFRTESAGFVVAVKMFTRSEDERDLFRVFQANDFDALVSVLENYDTAHDIDAISIDIDNEQTAPSLLALKGLGVRLRIEEGKRQYGDLVGEILYELDAG